MATLHSALKYLSPVEFSEVPSDQVNLDTWLSDLFTNSQVILDSIPIPDPPEATIGIATTVAATKASEVTPSSARSAPPSPDHEALRKEWGKPVKLGAKEAALGMSVYKLGGKDGKGAWFARRSVHEGLSFPRFRRALEMEFPESLAVQGAPGEGNVRGIGGETKVEDVKVPGKGRMEVFRLSAQFPGPTTPRDFVTLLVTSDNAMQPVKEGEPVPRHYMILSKPCDHLETQPQSGFIRGNYESVEFIREVPRSAAASQSLIDLTKQGEPESVGLVGETSLAVGDKSSLTRKRSVTAPVKPPALSEPREVLPIEWIMVTRSDPGGSVPRFMVERGTPSSICADAEKFLNWACQQDYDDEQVARIKDGLPPANAERRESFRNSRVAGLEDEDAQDRTSPLGRVAVAEGEVDNSEHDNSQEQQGVFMGAVSGAAGFISAHTPQVVLDRLSGSNTTSPEQSKALLSPPEPEDDAASTASFESADSHLDTSESEDSSETAAAPRQSEENLTPYQKELKKLEQRRVALEQKFSETRSKLQQETTAQSAKEELAQQKLAEKRERELKKQQEKYEKEMKKLEEKQEKERQKFEAKKRKEADKDEKVKLTRERDEARQALEISKKEAAVLRNAVESLQKENTTLVAKLGKLTASEGGSETDIVSPSRQDSHKSKKGRGHSNSIATSVKSQ